MATIHAVLVKAAFDGADEAPLAADFASLRRMLGALPGRSLLQRGLRTPDVYGYVVFAAPSMVADADRERLAALAAGLPAFAGRAPAIDRLQRVFATKGASCDRPAAFHYAVEMDPAPGWEEEIFRWYDTEHLPGLAAVPGCVTAQRFLNRDGGPYSLACYELTDLATIESSAWLAVRHTPWSDRVRPQFRNTRRTLFRPVRMKLRQATTG